MAELLLVVTIGLGATAAYAKGAAPKVFATPEEAVGAMIDALKAHDTKALLTVFGSSGERLVASGDAVADREASEGFVASYDEAHSIAKSGDDKAALQVGKDEWPFPIPLVHSAAGWHFDTDAGKEEILDRRIGRNELSAIKACLAYVDAQREYYERNPEQEKLRHYAQRIASTPGKRDGLYWESKAGEQESPLGPAYARARAEGYAAKDGKPQPFYGYYYRILTAQGPDAEGGAFDYMAHGKLFGGFALVAYPATYGNSGVTAFIVNHDGVVFQKDLGPDTARLAKAMKTFNPDSTWKRVEDSDAGK